MFAIKSAYSDRELIFSHFEGDYFQVEVKSLNVSGNAHVCAYTDANGLNKIFQEIGSLKEVWNGEKKWESLEGEFSLAVSCNKVGHVLFQIRMAIQQGSPEEAHISIGLITEFGSLSNLAIEAEAFFKN